MQTRSVTGAVMAGFCLAATIASSGRAGTTASRASDLPFRRAFPAASRPAALRVHPYAIAAPLTCTTVGDNAFSGGGGNNIPGGDDSVVVGGYGNDACDSYSGVVGGMQNDVGDDQSAQYSYIVGGYQNGIVGYASFDGAGATNLIGGTYAANAGGYGNMLAANNSFVGAGYDNTVAQAGTYGVIPGGNDNYVSGEFGTVGGGSGNKAEGAFAVIPGGADNEAFGAASFAGGYHADAAHNGSFVWSDDSSGSSLVSDAAANQFVVRASGGTFVYSSEKLTSGVELAPGSGTWASLSDRNSKTAIVPLDDDAILAKVASLPVSAWRYKTESGVRHVGPMAQDFYAAFGVGEDNRHITSIDEDGVALAAIKALDAKLARKDAEIARLRANFEARDAVLERRIDRLAARIH